MWNITVPWWELILRCIVVYVFLIALLRISGKRQVGQLAPFDLVLLLVLSNAVQNSMNGGDNSLIGGLISAATLVAINFAVGYVTFRNKAMEAVVEGRPQVLIHNGRVFESVSRSAIGPLCAVRRVVVRGGSLASMPTTRFPIRIARQKPTLFSYGLPDATRTRSMLLPP